MLAGTNLVTGSVEFDADGPKRGFPMCALRSASRLAPIAASFALACLAGVAMAGPGERGHGGSDRGPSHGSSHDSHGWDHGHSDFGHWPSSHHSSGSSLSISVGFGWDNGYASISSYSGRGYGRCDVPRYRYSPVYCPPRPVVYCPPPVVIAPCPAPVVVAPCPTPVVVERPVYVERPVVVDRPVVVEQPVVVSRPVVYQSTTVVSQPVVMADAVYRPNPLAIDPQTASLYWSMGDATKAITGLRAYLLDHPNDAAAKRLMGVIAIDQGQVESGLGWVYDAYATDPTLASRPFDANAAGITLDQMKRLQRAALDEAARSGSPRAWLGMIVLLQAEGKNDMAKSTMTKATDAGLQQAITQPLLVAMGG